MPNWFLSFVPKTPINTHSYGPKTMRPQKYPNLGQMSEKIRVPKELVSEMERLFTELDRIAVRIDPCEALSGFCDSLSDIEID